LGLQLLALLFGTIQLSLRRTLYVFIVIQHYLKNLQKKSGLAKN